MGSIVKTSVRKKKFIKRLADLGIRKDIIKLFSDFDLQIFFDTLFDDLYYTESRIPIGYGQTGDDPVTLARMLHYLDPRKDERILEIGTGSGFSTALLSLLCKEVYTVEYVEELAYFAKHRLYNYGYENVRFYAGDATEESHLLGTHFDRVIIHPGCRKRPLSVIAVVKELGRVVFPMGPALEQQILCLHNTPDEKLGERFKIDYHEFCSCDHIKGSYGLEAVNTSELLSAEPETRGNADSDHKKEE